MDDAAIEVEPAPAPSPPVPAAALLSYMEDMLLELAHMASEAGERALAATVAAAAVQAAARRRATEG